MEAARQVNTNDLSKIYAEDATMLPPNAPPIKGRSEIRTLFGKQFAGSDATFEFQTHELLVADDWPYRWDSYEVSITLENGNPVKQKDKFIEIWKKNTEGEWLIARNIWNRTSTSNGTIH